MTATRLIKALQEADDVLKDYDPTMSQRTQITGTLPTYHKVHDYLDTLGVPPGPALDFGAGKGLGSNRLGYDSYEPHPKGWDPDYREADDIPDGMYVRVVCMHVLNVVPPNIRSTICKQIASKLAPGGAAVLISRGSEVMNAQGTPGPEPMSIMTTRGTYQKGFSPGEFRSYLQSQFGSGFEVTRAGVGKVDALIVRS